jgi:hypothetical protein
MIVGNRNRRDAKHELIRKRPKQSLLKNISIKSKYCAYLKTHRSIEIIISIVESIERGRN